MSVRNRLGHRLPVLSVAAGTALLLLMPAGPAASASTLAARGPAPGAGDSPAAQSVSVSAAQRSLLEQLYASYRGIPRSDIASIRKFSVRGAYVASTRTQWATASFIPSLKDPVSVVAGFQDGAGTGVFIRQAGSRWRLLRVAGMPLSCPGVLPASVQRAWRLTGRAAACAAASQPRPARRASAVRKPATADPATIVQVAENNVGVSDTPASTNWGQDCSPYTTIVGAGGSTGGCGTDPTFNVQDENQLWCANFAKYVWEQGGVSADLGMLTPSAYTFASWGVAQHENLSFDGGNPVPGDAVVFYPAGTTSFDSYADHVGIVASVNSNGTVNLINGDFMGSSNISVQANDNESIASWAAAIWGSGEEWVYVSPGQIHLTGDATYAPGSNGSAQEIFARDTSGDTWEAWENSSGGWSGWHSLGGVVASDITYAPGSNGSVQEIFARNSAGTVYEDWENSNGGWSGWHSLGGTMAGDITYAPGMNGSVQEIFARTTSGTPEEDWEYSSGGWSGWTSLGGAISSNMTYGSVDSGALQEVWAHNSAGTVYVDVQDSNGWTGWQSAGGGAVGNITWAPGVDGEVQEVFARTSDGGAWADVETSSGWSGWIAMGGTLTSDLTYAPGSAGSVLELFALNSAGTPVEDWLSPSGWSGWTSRGGTLASTITYAPGSNGSAQEIFGINSSGTVYENWESSSGGWSGWHNLGP
jgi:hypothetical protein